MDKIDTKIMTQFNLYTSGNIKDQASWGYTAMVTEISQNIKTALLLHDTDNKTAIKYFNKALEAKNFILNDEKTSTNPRLREYVSGIIIESNDGDINDSFMLTIDAHENYARANPSSNDTTPI